MALIYLDEDSIPELLVIKNGSYRLYTFDGAQAAAIDMSDLEIRAKAYTLRHKVFYPQLGVKTLLDGGRRRTKNLYGVVKRTVPAGQVRQ